MIACRERLPKRGPHKLEERRRKRGMVSILHEAILSPPMRRVNIRGAAQRKTSPNQAYIYHTCLRVNVIFTFVYKFQDYYIVVLCNLMCFLKGRDDFR